MTKSNGTVFYLPAKEREFTLKGGKAKLLSLLIASPNGITWREIQDQVELNYRGRIRDLRALGIDIKTTRRAVGSGRSIALYALVDDVEVRNV